MTQCLDYLCAHMPTKYLDIHTHIESEGEDRLCVLSHAFPLENSIPIVGCASIGVHPWDINKVFHQNTGLIHQNSPFWHNLSTECKKDNVWLIGECGLDFAVAKSTQERTIQTEVFKRHVALSEEIHKPLLIHCVKAYNELLQLRCILHASQPWIIHGFRGKPQLARQILSHSNGYYLSFGELFNTQSLLSTPLDRLFIETDTSALPIGHIYSHIASLRGISTEQLQEHTLSNLRRIYTP